MPVTRNAVSTQAELADNENHPAELAETRHLNSIRASNESIASIPAELADRVTTVTSNQAVAFKAQRDLPEKGVFEDENSDGCQSSLSSYEGSVYFKQSTKHSELLDSEYGMEHVDLESYNESKRLHSESTTRSFYKQAECV